MILSFSVDNYLSFEREASVSLQVGASAPRDYQFLELADGGRAAKILGVFGANASGKTNLLRVLPMLANFITESFGFRKDQALPFEPHFFSADKVMRISVEFEVAEGSPRRYRYQLEATPTRVLAESLRFKSSRFYSRVFERRWEDDAYVVLGLGDRQATNLRENVSWIAWLVQYNIPGAVAIADYFRRLRSNLTTGGARMPSILTAFQAVEYFREHKSVMADMVSQLNRWDIDIDHIEFEEVKSPEVDLLPGPLWVPICLHKRGERTAKLPIMAESSGTMGLFSLFSIILPVLETGGVAVVDELEADLHPNMLRAVVDLFVMPETNPKNAQLLFTSHADWLMDFLHKQQIVLVEKRDGNSEVTRLSDVRGVLARENHAARYRAGAYGAVPDLR